MQYAREKNAADDSMENFGEHLFCDCAQRNSPRDKFIFNKLPLLGRETERQRQRENLWCCLHKNSSILGSFSFSSLSIWIIICHFHSFVCTHTQIMRIICHLCSRWQVELGCAPECKRNGKRMMRKQNKTRSQRDYVDTHTHTSSNAAYKSVIAQKLKSAFKKLQFLFCLVSFACLHR